MSETLKIIFGLTGGLAIFLFGMNQMSESLQKAAGEKMKKILSMLTSNPIKGVLAGALVTAVLQSSSATTVMAIGFVSAGLMSLPQAISVIFGANIGTTMTAQLIAFDIGEQFLTCHFLSGLVSLNNWPINIVCIFSEFCDAIHHHIIQTDQCIIGDKGCTVLQLSLSCFCTQINVNELI